MGRFARVVAVGVPHHITQRGNGKRYVLNTDADRAVYLGLLLENLKQHGASLLGYCLMSNHVHLVMIPDGANSLPFTMKHTHGRYASYWNARHGLSGHADLKFRTDDALAQTEKAAQEIEKRIDVEMQEDHQRK